MPLARHVLAPLAFAALLAGCGGDFYYAGAENDCTSLSARLSQIGFDPNDVASVETQVERASGEGGGVLRRWSWAKMKSCDGYVVVRVDGGCGPRASEPFTTGNCRIAEGKAA